MFAARPPHSSLQRETQKPMLQGANLTIAAIHLDLTGRVAGIDAAKFEEIAKDAKANCPVSRLLKAENPSLRPLPSPGS
jgi:osmotically inducible protein OsmC